MFQPEVAITVTNDKFINSWPSVGISAIWRHTSLVYRNTYHVFLMYRYFLRRVICFPLIKNAYIVRMPLKRYIYIFAFSSGPLACRHMLAKLVFLHHLRPVDHSNKCCTSRQSVHGSGSFDISCGA